MTGTLYENLYSVSKWKEAGQRLATRAGLGLLASIESRWQRCCKIIGVIRRYHNLGQTRFNLQDPDATYNPLIPELLTRLNPNFIILPSHVESNSVTMQNDSVRGLGSRMNQHIYQPEFELMQEKMLPRKRYIFASDFDQTLSFNDSGYVLSELLGIPASEFERKTTGMTKLNLVQQGGELAYLLLHDPEFRTKVRKEHLYEAGKHVRLKPNIDLLYRFLSEEVEGFHFDFYVISAGPVEVIRSALEGIIPADHIFGTEFEYNSDGEIERIKQVTAGYGKVAVIDQLLETLRTGPDRIVYVGDGSSDIHVMLHINRRDGFTIAVSENRYLAPIAKRSVISERCGLGQREDPRLVRRQRSADPAVGQSADRYADDCAHRDAGRRSSRGQRGLSNPNHF
jgi:HAD superfamily phosphoserine phosphatase-like hydrolase